MKKLLSILGFIFLLAACSKKGEEIEYFENGAIKLRAETVNGMRNGKLTTYHRDGKIYAVGDYVDGLPVRINYYHKSGELRAKENFSDGKLHGINREYYESGKLLSLFTHQNGEVVSSFFFNEKGDTLLIYKNGKSIDYFYNLKLRGIYCNADTTNFSVIEFDSISGGIIRIHGNLQCLNKKDSVLLTKHYPNWQTMLQQQKTTSSEIK